MIPVIHGMGRIMFTGFEIAIVPLKMIKPIPDGPPMDEAFVKEGIRLLEENSGHGFPYMVTVFDFLANHYWIIDGRHRHASYMAVHPEARIPILVGHGMKIMGF